MGFSNMLHVVLGMVFTLLEAEAYQCSPAHLEGAETETRSIFERRRSSEFRRPLFHVNHVTLNIALLDSWSR